MTKAKPSICFVAHNAYGVLAGLDTGHMGGIEVQTSLMAHWLSKEGYDISVITWDEHGKGVHFINGIRLIPLCSRDSGIPIIRFLVPRWSSLISALNTANSDIIYYNCGDLGLGQIAHWARAHKKYLFYTIANEVDCKSDLPALKPLRERVLYKYGLRKSDKIVTQTSKQQKLLKQDFSLQATLIPMPCKGFDVPANRFSPNQRVLWVGRFTTEKRLDWLLDVAEKLPHICFDVLGAANIESIYAKDLTQRANGIDNVTLHGRVSQTDMVHHYKNATLLISTSIYEGFPNVFLEAWSMGIPLVTSFDPDSVVERYGMGHVSKDINGFVNGIELLSLEDNWQKASAAALNYFNDNHTVDRCLLKFKLAIDELVS